MPIITTEMLFDNNIQKIVGTLENSFGDLIQKDFDEQPDKYPDLISWMEQHPREVGIVFMAHIIDYGITNEDLQ